LAVGEDAVWVSDVADDRVLRIDPATGAVVTSIDVGTFPHSLELGTDGRLWVTNFLDGTVSQIDTDTDAVVTTIPVGIRPGGVMFDHGSLWVAVYQEATLRPPRPGILERPSLRPIDEREETVDLGDRGLFLRCMGTSRLGTPTVISRPGAAVERALVVSSSTGSRLLLALCAYDRAGLGRSDPGPEPRTAVRIADDLHRALDAAAIPARTCSLARTSAGCTPTSLPLPTATTWSAWSRSTPSRRRSSTRCFRCWIPRLEPSSKTDCSTRSSRESARASVNSWRPVSLGDLPLIVVSHDRAAPAGALADPAIEALWQREQRDLLELSTRSRLALADVPGGSSIAARAPGAVVDAVRAILDEVHD
jgi:YVTN family beta-propeller protein